MILYKYYNMHDNETSLSLADIVAVAVIALPNACVREIVHQVRHRVGGSRAMELHLSYAEAILQDVPHDVNRAELRRTRWQVKDTDSVFFVEPVLEFLDFCRAMYRRVVEHQNIPMVEEAFRHCTLNGERECE
jgi:hypothetical protein